MADERWNRWIVGFVVAAVVFQLGLYQLGDTAFRMPLRIGMFGISLAFLFLPRRGATTPHPAGKPFQFVAVVLAIALLNPDGAGLLAGIAQGVLYIAVLAPLLWVPRFRYGWPTFRAVVLILWGFNLASAAVGVLQIKYPGQFEGALSSNMDEFSKGALSIVTADGNRILRPKGLTDTPGGAGAGGVYAIILGLGLLLTDASLAVRVVSILGVGVSIFSIYLSQGRTNLVLVGVCVIVVLATLLRRGDTGRAIVMGWVLFGSVVVGTTLAFAVGGRQTLERWQTLTADDPTAVFQENRGQFLDELLHDSAYKYPFGAGGGRWGMMNSYFGDPAKSLWAEMQWQAFLYDGGLPLIGLYAAVLGTILWVAYRMALFTADATVGCWWAVLLGFDLSTVAASFVFPIYIKDVGLEMFLLNGCLYGLSSRFPRAGLADLPGDRQIPQLKSGRDLPVASPVPTP